MKQVFVFLLGVGVVLIFYALITAETDITKPVDESTEQAATRGEGLVVWPISHASGVLEIGGGLVYIDPVGGAAAFLAAGPADLVLVTDTHGDHLDPETLAGVLNENTAFIAPQAVVDELPEALKAQAEVLHNGEEITRAGFSIEAVPMYNLPESSDSRHVKGRGNGYVLTRNGMRIYIAGDTSGVPEMRALENISVAFVPMNPPYTMDVEEAADAVLEFAPEEVYPYHYRTPEGFSDVEEFKRLVNAGDPNINVVLLNWYPSSE